MNLSRAEANRAMIELGLEYSKQFRLDVIEKLSNKLQEDWNSKDKEDARFLYPEDMELVLEAQFELYDCKDYEQRKVKAVNHFNRKRELADAIYKDTLAKLEADCEEEEEEYIDLVLEPLTPEELAEIERCNKQAEEMKQAFKEMTRGWTNRQLVEYYEREGLDAYAEDIASWGELDELIE